MGLYDKLMDTTKSINAAEQELAEGLAALRREGRSDLLNQIEVRMPLGIYRDWFEKEGDHGGMD